MNSQSNLEKYDPKKFIVTAEHQRFEEFCDNCRSYRYVGVCTGRPEIGKTWSAFHYNHWGCVDAATRSVIQRDPIDSMLASCRTIVYRVEIVNTPKQIVNAIALLRRRLNGVVREAVA